jgi:hypothetical protein
MTDNPCIEDQLLIARQRLARWQDMAGDPDYYPQIVAMRIERWTAVVERLEAVCCL